MKAEYYLTHETERLQIATNAYKRTLREHTYDQRVHLMLKHLLFQREENMMPNLNALNIITAQARVPHFYEDFPLILFWSQKRMHFFSFMVFIK